MIHYELQCDQQHRFDGWFPGSVAFEHQAAAGLLQCPSCASIHITRALMAPAVKSGRAIAAAEPEAAPETAPVPQPGTAVAGAIPDAVRAVLQRLRAEVEGRCDYVGNRFADQARQMHEGELPSRPIYGETTPDEAESLAEDGIAVARIPWIDRADG